MGKRKNKPVVLDGFVLPAGRCTYSEFCKTMRAWNDIHYRTDGKLLHGVIVFTEESFDKPYPLMARSYGVCSDNKAWISGMGGYSIYGGSMDGSDPCVRLDYLMAAEHAGNNGWHVAYCYFEA